MASENNPGRLNVFQRAMLQWNDMHPYHAVHVLRLQGTPEPERLGQIITNRLRRCGLSGLRLDRKASTFRYDGKPSQIEVRSVAASDDPTRSFHEEIEQQLNRRFVIDGRFVPFRFFVLPDGDSFLLGTTYFHPIADAESVVILMRELTMDYVTGRTPNITHPLDCHPPLHDRLLWSRPGLLARKLLALPSDIRMTRRSHRTPLHDADELSNRFRFMAVPSKALSQWVSTAKAWEVTLHDLLLAILMKALSPIAPDRSQERRRQNIALGTIVNVRRDLDIDSQRTFGLFLGAFKVSHPVPDGISLRELASDVRHQTRRIKRSKLYLTTPLELRLAGRLIAMYSTPRQRRFYHKNHPLWGGITNMNMNQLWPETNVRPLDYFRAVSTGPTTPLVLSVTTFGDHMNIALTYRPAVFTSQEIDLIQAGLNQQFSTVEDSR